MIDHLLRYANEAQAQLALPAYFAGGAWRLDICIPGAAVYSVAANGAKTPDANWYIWISLPTADAVLKGLPSCTMILDRDAADKSLAFITVTSLDGPTLSSLFVQPLNAGARYLKTAGQRDILANTTVVPGEVGQTTSVNVKGA